MYVLDTYNPSSPAIPSHSFNFIPCIKDEYCKKLYLKSVFWSIRSTMSRKLLGTLTDCEGSEMAADELDASTMQDSGSGSDTDTSVSSQVKSLAEKPRLTKNDVQGLYERYRGLHNGLTPFIAISIKEVPESVSHRFDESVSSGDLLGLLEDWRYISAKDAVAALRTLYERAERSDKKPVKMSPTDHLPF